MNDRWTDLARAIAEASAVELRSVEAELAALPHPSPALAARAAELRNRLVAAQRVLDADATPARPAEVAA